MPSNIRRVITGHNDSGASCVSIDQTMTGDDAHVMSPAGQPNVRLADIWTCSSVPTDNTGNADSVGDRVILEPPSGGVVFRTVEIPPDSERNYDTMRAYFESMGAGDRLDGQKHPGMHKTNTLDFLIVVSGEICLILDEEEVLLKQGDTCVQRGTLHAWSNRTDSPCVLAGILVDAAPLASAGG